MVKSRARELEEENINVKRLSEKEEEKLNHLRTIETYLNRTIDEHQKILSSHFDLKSLYTRELENLTQMSLIKRFPLRSSLYDKVLENPAALENLDFFQRPLFNQDMEKIYNLNKAFDLQKPVSKNKEEDDVETLDFDQESWEAEQERLKREKLKKYEESLLFLLNQSAEQGETSLQKIAVSLDTDEEKKTKLIPSVEIFKELMVELIKNPEMDIEILRRERSEYI